MSYTFLREQGEESSVEFFSDIPAYVLSRLNLIVEKSYCSDSEMDAFQSSQSGTTCEPLMENLGEERLMPCVGVSRAPKLARLDTEPDSKVSAADYGLKWPESFARFDQGLSLWKIRQTLLFADLERSLETWPKWGLMHNGECWECAALVDCIGENAYGWLPTPSATDTGCRISGNPVVTCNGSLRHIGKNGTQSQFRVSQVVHLLNHEIAGPMNPGWQEWLMGWPIGQSDLKPLETDKFRQWLHSHGKR